MLDAHRIFRDHMEQPQPCPWRYDRLGPERRPQVDGDAAPQFVCRINDDWYSWKAYGTDASSDVHGRLLHEMTHFVDLANWFLAAEPVEVVAVGPNRLNEAAIVTYDNGAVATISMSGNGSWGYPKELYEICGNGGFIAIDHMLEVRTGGIAGVAPVRRYPLRVDAFPEIGAEGGLHGWLAKQRAAEQRAVEEHTHAYAFSSRPDKGHAGQLERFVDQIRGRGEVVCGIDAAILATEVCFAAVLSAREKRPVRVEEVRGSKPALRAATASY